jgi:hypothetical protein
MRFRSRKDADGTEPPIVEDEVVTHPLSDLIASIEHTVENFKEVDVPHWKYRQIIREGKRSADQALSEAQGAPTPRYGK